MADLPAPPAVPPRKAPRRSTRIIQVIVFTGLWVGALFGSAGRWDWTRGWIFTALYSAGMAGIGIAAHRRNPTIIAARARWRHKDTKRFDRIFIAIYFPLTYVQPAVAGLDAVRFRWTSMPVWPAYPGTVLLELGIALIAWVMAVNPFAETTVRIQTDRGHSVVAAGPYRFVRHPMYAGAILLYVASPFVVGSYWALAVAGVIVALYLWRTAMEDRTLRRELPGYDEFAARTRYRLVPGLW